MKKNRFTTPSAVFGVIIQDNQILLQKRQNTGYRDGYYDFAATGHVEDLEKLTTAMVREFKEELNIDILEKDLEFMTMTHRKDKVFGTIYYDTYFLVTHYEGTPMINEPNKCEELQWFPLNNLPDNLIDDRLWSFNNYLNHIYYGEYGWDN
ncbi:MAG: NUDIX domain-containing protein [Erysipelotrichaceae bacterium]|nr:NUDIX domain-containing protein [Erysipelotrichaceae bacterium]